MFNFPTVLAGLALGALVAPAAAQDYIPVNVIKHAKYDMATQTYTVLPSDPDIGPGDSGDIVVVYDNSTTNGFLTTGSGAVKTHHFMDWGTLTTSSGLGATITEIRVAYATNTVAPGTVGARVRIYDGATGNGNKGTVNANGNLVLTGLPNSTSGGYEGWLVDVALTTPITLADGAIGWSFNADGSGGTTATGPLLAGPPNGPGAGPAHPAPAVGFGSYDRYLETTDAYVSTSFGAGPTMISIATRLKGRVTGAPTGPWVNYGSKNGVTLNATGSATPGSFDNVISIKNNPAGKSVILVAGVSQSDFFKSSLGLHFYAHPWVLQLAPILTDPFSGEIALPAPLPGSLSPGNQIYMQAFGENLSDQYKKWSEGLQLTVQ
ncbi:MAG: hypothetical protein FJ296_04625 [Planctomycetes bacterium]|nr:hypothetical protein [Planctomycetota bacterium]